MQNVGSLPVIECRLVRNQWRNGKSVEWWAFDCPHCGVLHFHAATGERLVSHVCTSEAGQQAFKYGYLIRLAGSSDNP